MPPNKYADFGSWVKAERERLHLTQEELANSLGYMVDSISKAEQNRYASKNLIEALKERLEISDADYPEFSRLGQTLGKKPKLSDEITLRSKAIKHLLFRQGVAVIILVALVIVILASLIVTHIDPPSIAGVVTVVGSNNQFMSIQVGNQTTWAQGAITLAHPIKIKQSVTVTFKIINSDTHSIRIKALGCGAQGPSSQPATWSSPSTPFPEVYNIFLQPGETYEYQQSRELYAPGYYFVEPLIKFEAWGGISPYPHINFLVQ